MMIDFHGGFRSRAARLACLHLLALVCALMAGVGALLPLAAKGSYEVDVEMLWSFRFVSTLNALPTALYALPAVVTGVAVSMLRQRREGAELTYMVLAAAGLLITGIGTIAALGHFTAMGYCSRLAGSAATAASAHIGAGAAAGFGAYGVLFLAPFFLSRNGAGESPEPPPAMHQHCR